MRRHVNTLPALVAFALLATPLRAEAGSPPAADNEESILVLLSGEVIRGRVSHLDDRYLVALPTGRIFVPMSNVELVCKDLEEAYQLRRSRMGQGQAQDHAALAQWCQRQGLNDRAEEELSVARQLDADHPMVGLVERRLRVLREPLGATGGGEKEAGLEPTPQQLEDFAAGLPTGTVEAFTRVVQPLLLNRCATAGCHNSRSGNDFCLERTRPGVPLGRTSTHRNLLATLKLVDATVPDQCELLRPKKCPHRLQTEATLSLSRTGQYRFLVAWVTLLTQQQSFASSSAPAATPAGPPPTIQTGPAVTPSSEAILPSSASGTVSDSLKASFDALSGREVPAAPQVMPAQPLGATDPFDPEIFNRRYGTIAGSTLDAPEADRIPLPRPDFAK